MGKGRASRVSPQTAGYALAGLLPWKAQRWAFELRLLCQKLELSHFANLHNWYPSTVAITKCYGGHYKVVHVLERTLCCVVQDT